MTPGAPASGSVQFPQSIGEGQNDTITSSLGLGVGVGAMSGEQERQRTELRSIQQRKQRLLQQLQLVDMLEIANQRESELQQQQQAFQAAPSLPPHPEDQALPPTGSRSPDDLPISKSDPRYETYFHLCGLFDEGQVRRVMNSNPLETNPKVLCAQLCESMQSSARKDY